MTAGPAPADRIEQIAAWARGEFGRSAAIRNCFPMPGNSGLSYGFDVACGSEVIPLVIRLAPPGVRRRGNTDVLRLVPLLRALQDAGVPVARLVGQAADDSWFGTDAVIQHRVAAAPLHMTDPSLSVAVADGDTTPFVRAAVRALAAVHALDWRARLRDWEQPRPLADEIGTWTHLLGRVADDETQTAGRRVAAALLTARPADPDPGLTHGDYQTNNVLFAPGTSEVVAIVDWELAGIGAQPLDLAWLSMMTDPRAWAPQRRASMRVTTDPAALLDWYGRAGGQPVADFDWYRALACFRFGVIAAFNLGLHRKGQRIDPSYERIASSVPALFQRAGELLGERG